MQLLLSRAHLTRTYKYASTAGRITSLSKPLNVGIVGGSIAGLYAALLLQSNGHRVRVFEGTDRVGGRVYIHYFTQEEDQHIVHAAHTGCWLLAEG